MAYDSIELSTRPETTRNFDPKMARKYFQVSELVLEHIACFVIGHERFNFFSIDLNNFNLKTVGLKRVEFGWLHRC